MGDEANTHIYSIIQRYLLLQSYMIYFNKNVYVSTCKVLRNRKYLQNHLNISYQFSGSSHKKIICKAGKDVLYYYSMVVLQDMSIASITSKKGISFRRITPPGNMFC